MKKNILIFVILLSISSVFAQTEFTIESNPGTPSSQYTLAANRNFGIHFNVFIDANSTLKGFKTTFGGTHELVWDLTKFEKNKWIEIAHEFTTSSEMVNPVLKISMINDNNTGFGSGLFYIDDIRIYDKSSLSTEDLENRITIYPNPANDYLYIKNLSNTSEIFFYSVLGSKLKPNIKSTGNDYFSIDIQNYPVGVYFLKINQSGKILTKRIIKN